MAAIFGFHIILTLLSATIFGKIKSLINLCDYFVFNSLYYYLLEGSLFASKLTDEKSQRQQMICGNNNIKKRRRASNTSHKISPTENEEKQKSNFRLIRLPLNLNVLEGVPFFYSLIWNFNYSCFALIVFVLSDLYNLIFWENKDLNTSLIWTFCALILQIHILLIICFEKISVSQLFPERNTFICATGFFFLTSLIFNVFADQFLDIEFSKGYIHFIDSLNEFIQNYGFLPLFSSSSARSPLLFLISLAFLFSIILSCFFFPLIQFTNLYFDSIENLQNSGESRNIFVRLILLHTSFLAPIGIFLLFLRPVVEQILETQIVTHEQLKCIRLLLLFVILIVKLGAAKICLQTFLDRPKNLLNEYSFKNIIKEEEPNYASYACTAALQYYMPIAIILSTGLILKNFADISFYSLLPTKFFFSKIETTESSTILSSKEEENVVNNQQKQLILNILFSKEFHEPLWTLALTIFIFGQIIICLFGVIMRKTMLGGERNR